MLWEQKLFPNAAQFVFVSLQFEESVVAGDVDVVVGVVVVMVVGVGVVVVATVVVGIVCDGVVGAVVLPDYYYMYHKFMRSKKKSEQNNHKSENDS